MKTVEQLFDELLQVTEIRKIDYKRNQYRLDNDPQKAQFIKDVLCIANAPGDDGYLLLGVESEKGKAREVVGISKHYDSSDLEQLVNSKIESSIQFDYYALKYKGLDCALIHIPHSKARPHWPKADFHTLKKHVFYTRRASGNREATMPEIREMFMETLRVTETVAQKMKTSSHVIDELADMSLDERKNTMFNMLKRVTKNVGLKKYVLIMRSFLEPSEPICAIVNIPNNKLISECAVFMYPWTPTRDVIRYSSQGVIERSPYSTSIKIGPKTRERLSESSPIHVSYKNINTKALERWPLLSTGYWFANKWTEPWGIIMKWEIRRLKPKRIRYEFFLPNVSSEVELRDRVQKLLLWIQEKVE